MVAFNGVRVAVGLTRFGFENVDPDMIDVTMAINEFAKWIHEWL